MKHDLEIFLLVFLSCAKRQDPGHQTFAACSDVGLLINEHAATGEGSVHFALFTV